MAKRRRKVARDPLLDRLMGRALLASESVRKEFVERLVDAIADVGWRDEQGVIAVVRAYMATYEPLLAEHLSNAMILTWLGAYIEQAQHLPTVVQRWMRDHAFWAQQPPEIPGIFGPGDKSPPAVRFPRIEKAAESLFDRGLLTRPQYDRLSAAAKQATFTVAWIDDTKVIGQIRDALAQTIQEGPTLERFRENVEERLEASPMGAARSENVYRTGLMSAYRDGRESLAQHPIVREVFRFRSFYAIHDGRVRDEHLAFETFGIEGSNIYLSDDPVWDIASPPLGYNCRCVTSLLRIADAARYGLEYAKEWLKTGVQPSPIPYCIDKVTWRPDPGFGVRHGPLLSTSTASSVRMSAQPIRLGDVNPWQPYKGPRGGTGWQRAETDEVRYVKERPGAHETGGDTTSKPQTVAPEHAAVGSVPTGGAGADRPPVPLPQTGDWQEIRATGADKNTRLKAAQAQLKKTDRRLNWESQWAKDSTLRSMFHAPIGSREAMGFISHLVEKFGTYPIKVKFVDSDRAGSGAEAQFFVNKIWIGREGMNANVLIHELAHYVNRELAFDKHPTDLNRIPDHGKWFNKSVRLVADAYLEYKGVNLTMNEWAKKQDSAAHLDTSPAPSAPLPARQHVAETASKPIFAKADEDAYIDVVRRNRQMRLPRPGETADDIRGGNEWNERREKESRQAFRESNVHLVEIPVSMLRIKADRDVADDRQARLDKIGGSDDPIMVSLDRDGSGGLMLNIDDGNNRAEWARKHGKKTIKAFAHEYDKGDMDTLRRMLENK